MVFDDADLISAVNGVAFASFVASGQTCVSGTRLIIQEGIYDVFLKLFLEKVESIKRRMGDRKFRYLHILIAVFTFPSSFQPTINDGHCHIFPQS